MKMRRCLLGAGLLAIVGLGGACAHESKQESTRKMGQKVGEAVATKVQFADQLSLLDHKEIALAALALEKSSTTEVRAFAQQLLENHHQHLASLERYAEASALRLAVIDLSTETAMGGSGGAGMTGATEAAGKQSKKYDEKLDKQIQEFEKQVQELSSKSGKDFDKDFLEQVQKDQKRGVELAQKGIKEYADDASLTVLLGRSAPIFERQEERARMMRQALD